MKKKTILLIFFSIVLIGAIIWCVNTPYREVNLNDTLETIQKNDTCITVHDLYKDKEWDKGNQLVAFSSVYRNVIDFSPLNKKTYKSSDKICIINKVATDC